MANDPLQDEMTKKLQDSFISFMSENYVPPASGKAPPYRLRNPIVPDLFLPYDPEEVSARFKHGKTLDFVLADQIDPSNDLLPGVTGHRVPVGIDPNTGGFRYSTYYYLDELTQPAREIVYIQVEHAWTNRKTMIPDENSPEHSSEVLRSGVIRDILDDPAQGAEEKPPVPEESSPGFSLSGSSYFTLDPSERVEDPWSGRETEESSRDKVMDEILEEVSRRQAEMIQGNPVPPSSPEFEEKVRSLGDRVHELAMKASVGLSRLYGGVALVSMKLQQAWSRTAPKAVMGGVLVSAGVGLGHMLSTKDPTPLVHAFGQHVCGQHGQTLNEHLRVNLSNHYFHEAGQFLSGIKSWFAGKISSGLNVMAEEFRQFRDGFQNHPPEAFAGMTTPPETHLAHQVLIHQGPIHPHTPLHHHPVPSHHAAVASHEPAKQDPVELYDKKLVGDMTTAAAHANSGMDAAYHETLSGFEGIGSDISGRMNDIHVEGSQAHFTGAMDHADRLYSEGLRHLQEKYAHGLEAINRQYSHGTDHLNLVADDGRSHIEAMGHTKAQLDAIGKVNEALTDGHGAAAGRMSGHLDHLRSSLLDHYDNARKNLESLHDRTVERIADEQRHLFAQDMEEDGSLSPG